MCNNLVQPTPALSLSTKAKRRMRTSREEMAVLEEHYQSSKSPSHQEKQAIAKKLDMSEKSVHFWFQNRRAKENKQKKLRTAQKQKQKKASAAVVVRNNNPPPTITSPTRESARSFKLEDVVPPARNEPTTLPPISSLMNPAQPGLNVIFYFHHSKFGIEDCMHQWSEFHRGNAHY